MGALRSTRYAILAVALAFLAGAASTAPAVTGAPQRERVWRDGVEWGVMIVRDTTIHGRSQPFYLIAAIDGSNPQSRGMWGFGPHDHVIGSPREGATGACKVVLVVPGLIGVPGVNVDVVPDPDLGIPFVRAADADGDGALEPLTSTTFVEGGVAAGLLALFEPQPGGVPIVFTCPVRPLQG